MCVSIEKSLVGLGSGVNFTNILCAAFTRADPKFIVVFLHFWDLIVQKLLGKIDP
jgi:hypothetical protein